MSVGEITTMTVCRTCCWQAILPRARSPEFYRNGPAGQFTDIHAGLPGIERDGSVRWADYDKDGGLDILLTGAGTRIFRNLGDDQFADIQAVLPAMSFGSTGEWGDF